MGTVCCPKCGSYKIVDAVLDENLERHNDTRYYCSSCRSNFGHFSGHSVYADIVKEISLDIKGFFTDKICFHASNLSKGIFYTVSSARNDIDFTGTVLQEEWQILSNKLFNEYFLEEWKQTYYSTDIVDGTSWTLDVKLKRKHALQFHGCNGFPPYWNNLLFCIEPFFLKAGITLEEFKI